MLSEIVRMIKGEEELKWVAEKYEEYRDLIGEVYVMTNMDYKMYRITGAEYIGESPVTVAPFYFPVYYLWGKKIKSDRDKNREYAVKMKEGSWLNPTRVPELEGKLIMDIKTAKKLNKKYLDEKTLKSYQRYMAKQGKIVDSMMMKKDKCAGGHSKAYEVPIKSKLGKFSVEWYSYNTTQTPEEKKLNAVYKQLHDERHATGKLLRRKLDDITLKINISGLDGDTTQLLKDFLTELERIEG